LLVVLGSCAGLLVRQVRYTDSPVGMNPTQVDYADYRDVAGVKMPFKWTVTWTDGRSVIQLTDVKANAPVDAAKFAKPSPPAPPPPAKSAARQVAVNLRDCATRHSARLCTRSTCAQPHRDPR